MIGLGKRMSVYKILNWLIANRAKQPRTALHQNSVLDCDHLFEKDVQ